MTLAPIVVTRLAVRRRDAPAPPPDDWVRARAALLRKLAWPAMRHAGRGIAWVLVVDPEHRGLVSELLADVELDGGSVHLAEGIGFAPATDELRLDREVHPDRDAFVTIRLDSDDALLPGSVDAVLDRARGAAPEALIDLPHGYQLDLDGHRLVEVANRRRRQGPFLALVHHDRSSMFDTGGEHTQARAGRQVLRVELPTWVQGIHATNLSNTWRGKSIGVRAMRALRAAPHGEAATLWRDGRPVRPALAAAILERAGLGDLARP